MKQTVFQSGLLVLFTSLAMLACSSAEGQWISGPIQQGDWGPWQPIPNPGNPTPVQPDGGWSPWQPQQPSTPRQPQPSPWQPQPSPWQPQPSPWQPQPSPWQPQPSPWQPQPTPIGPLNPTGNSFLVTVVNRMNGPINFQMGGQSQTIQPQQSAQFNTVEGTEYSYSGPSYEAQPGRWVGGGVYRGVVSVAERTITVGGQTDQNPSPNPQKKTILVTVSNRMNGPVTFQIGTEVQTIQSQQSWQFNGVEGTAYSYSGPSREIQPGRWVSGVTRSGVLSSNEPTINIGEQPGPGPEPRPNPNRDIWITVRFVNTYSGEVSISIIDKNQNQVNSFKIPAGRSVEASVVDGYTYVQGGPVVHVNGGAISGTKRGQISASNPEIQLRD